MSDLYSMQERYLQTGLAKKLWQPSCKFNDIVLIKTFFLYYKKKDSLKTDVTFLRENAALKGV